MTMRHSLAACLTLFAGGAAYAQHDGAMHHQAAGHERPAAQVGHPDHAVDAAPARTPAGPHGGSIKVVGGVRLETLIEPGGIRLYAYNAQGQPLSMRGVRGVATLQLKGDAKRYRYDLFPEVREDQSAESLSVSVDLRKHAGHDGRLTFQLAGLAGSARSRTAFSAPFVGPMSEQQRAAAAIAEQKTCPVSGQPLGSMGDPVPVTVAGDTIYVCCAACVDKAQANFAAYLQKLHAAPTLVIGRATDADAGAIRLQKTCPVSGQPLGSMGTPIKVAGLQRDVYLCCQACVDSLEQEPAKHLAKLPPLPEAAAVRATAVDAPFVTAQKRCPVMDEPLDAMGGPFRTTLKGRVVYICCPGCEKKLRAAPDKYLAKLAGQGINPPTAR